MYLHDCGTKYGLGMACHVYGPRDLHLSVLPIRRISPILNCLRVAGILGKIHIFTFIWNDCSRPESPHKSGLCPENEEISSNRNK